MLRELKGRGRAGRFELSLFAPPAPPRPFLPLLFLLLSRWGAPGRVGGSAQGEERRGRKRAWGGRRGEGGSLGLQGPDWGEGTPGLSPCAHHCPRPDLRPPSRPAGPAITSPPLPGPAGSRAPLLGPAPGSPGLQAPDCGSRPGACRPCVGRADLLRRPRFASNGPLQPPRLLPAAECETRRRWERLSGRGCGRRRGWARPQLASWAARLLAPEGLGPGREGRRKSAQAAGRSEKAFLPDIGGIERNRMEIPDRPVWEQPCPRANALRICRQPRAGPRCALCSRLQPPGCFAQPRPGEARCAHALLPSCLLSLHSFLLASSLSFFSGFLLLPLPPYSAPPPHPPPSFHQWTFSPKEPRRPERQPVSLVSLGRQGAAEPGAGAGRPPLPTGCPASQG